MGYLAFNRTGNEDVDKLLHTIEKAGKAFHMTEQWDDETGEMYGAVGNTPTEWIENAALELAKKLESK